MMLVSTTPFFVATGPSRALHGEFASVPASTVEIDAHADGLDEEIGEVAAAVPIAPVS